MKQVLLTLLILVAPPAPPAPPAPGAHQATTAAPHIAVVGASASAGWGVVVPQSKATHDGPSMHHRHIDLAEVIDVVLQPQTAQVDSHATSMFFRAPNTHGPSQINAAIADKVDLVIGIDFLFWYAYGFQLGVDHSNGGDTPERLASLERGLAQLDRLTVPVVIGDIPDMRSATDAGPIPLLSKGQVPSPKGLTAINIRIHEWAEARPSVSVVPLADLVSAMQRGDAIEIGQRPWPPDARLLQADRLHPTTDGLFAVAVLAADAAAASHQSLSRPGETTSPATIRAAMQTPATTPVTP